MRHGGQKKGDGWHLAWIKVNNASTGAVTMFKCNRWVDRRGLGDPGAVAAVTALPPDAAAAAAGVQRSAKDRALLQKGKALALRAPGGVAAAAAAQAPLVPDRRMEADLGGTAGVVESATGPVAGPPAGPPGYRIAFHTSRMCGSGTHAKVGRSTCWAVGAGTHARAGAVHGISQGGKRACLHAASRMQATHGPSRALRHHLVSSPFPMPALRCTWR